MFNENWNKNCKHCRWFDKGKCHCNWDFKPVFESYKSPAEDMVISFFEDGYADEIIRESMPEFKLDKYDIFEEVNLSEKRKNIIMKRIQDEYHVLIENIVENINDNLYRALIARAKNIKQEKLAIEIVNENEFCCRNID